MSASESAAMVSKKATLIIASENVRTVRKQLIRNRVFKICRVTNFNLEVDTVWKFHDFSITKILREFNFGETRGSKNAILAILGALEFVNLVKITLQKVQKFIKIKIQGLKM